MNPRKLFLIDGFGAILSAFLLGVVLVKYEHLFGIPSSTLYLLASLPVFFAIYDLFSYRISEEKLGVFLKGIGIINILYCCLSLGFSFYHIQEITSLGWGYILLEIIIVLSIAALELKVAFNLNKVKK